MFLSSASVCRLYLYVYAECMSECTYIFIYVHVRGYKIQAASVSSVSIVFSVHPSSVSGANVLNALHVPPVRCTS